VTYRDAKLKKPWLTTFFRRVIVGQSTRRHHELARAQPQETGFRDPFVEGSQLPEPPTPEYRQLKAFAEAQNSLSKTQRSDSVEHLDDSPAQFREGLSRVFGSLTGEDHPNQRIRDLNGVVEQLAWLIEQRLEQVATLRASISKHCPSGLTARILKDSAPQRGEFWKPSSAPALRCGGDEHVYQVGEPRCDCGTVAVRLAEATS